MSIKELLEDEHEKMELQRMLDDFCDLTGLAAVVSDASGNMLTELSNVTKFCSVMRSQPGLCAKSDRQGGKLAVESGKACIYRCHAGLIDFAVPVFVDGKHEGNVLTGQVRTKMTLSHDFSETRLEDIDFNQELLKSYFDDIPMMDEDRIIKSTKVLEIIARYLEDRIGLNRLRKGDAVQSEQMEKCNAFKRGAEMVVDCLRTIKYDMGIALIADLLEEHIVHGISKLNEELYKNIYYYEMKRLNLNIESMTDYECETVDFFYNIFDELFSQILERKCFGRPEDMEYAIGYIQRYSSEKMTSKNVSDYMNLSSDYFGKLFKERFNQSVTDYIVHYKVGIAKRRLVMSDESITEIALDLGYSDVNYFSRVFKKVIGVSPKQYKGMSEKQLKKYVNKITE